VATPTKLTRKEQLERFIRVQKENVEALIFCTEDSEQLVYLASLLLVMSKNILEAQYGPERTIELIKEKLGLMEQKIAE
jgi:hypothetical protein